MLPIQGRMHFLREYPGRLLLRRLALGYWMQPRWGLPNTHWDRYKKSGASAMRPYQFLVGMARQPGGTGGRSVDCRRQPAGRDAGVGASQLIAVRRFHPFRCDNGIIPRHSGQEENPAAPGDFPGGSGWEGREVSSQELEHFKRRVR